MNTHTAIVVTEPDGPFTSTFLVVTTATRTFKVRIETDEWEGEGTVLVLQGMGASDEFYKPTGDLVVMH
jgi:hypothetical protein